MPQQAFVCAAGGEALPAALDGPPMTVRSFDLRVLTCHALRGRPRLQRCTAGLTLASRLAHTRRLSSISVAGQRLNS
jgi:hypothetical protein